MNNTTILIGNIVNDLELKHTGNGKEYLAFNIAVRRNYKNAEGQYDTDYFPVVVYGATAKYLNDYSGKGMKVAVSGSLRTRSYVNKDGQNVRVTEIIANGVELMSKPNYSTTIVTETRPATPQNVQVRPAYPQTNITYQQEYPQNYRAQYEGGISLSDSDLDDTFGQEINITDSELPF